MNETNILENQPIAWRPSKEVIEKSQLTKFMRQTGAADWDELYKQSVEDVEGFTGEVLKFLDIKFDPPYEKLLDTSEGIEWSKWCVGGGLNITEMCLDRWMGTEIEDQAAIIWEGEEGEVEEVSYKKLLEQVELCAAGLHSNDFGKGDAVGIHLPMMIETVVALLAIGRIGAIAVPVFSGYGVEAIASRLNAVKAKGLVMCDGFYRRGKIINATQTAFEAAEKCPTIRKLISVSSAEKESMMKRHRIMLRFFYAFYSLYPNIDMREIRKAESLVIRRKIHERMKKFFQSRKLSIEPEELFERLQKIAATKSDEPEFRFEQVVKQYQDEGINVKLEDLNEAFSFSRPSFNYEKIIDTLEEKGYEIDRDLLAKEMEKEPPKPAESSKEAGAGATVGVSGVKVKISSKYSFELIPWAWLLNSHSHTNNKTEVEKTDANDPLIILYSSGTTGRPKGIAHVHCGFPVKAAQDMAFGTDVGRGTRISWVTDIGWMMGPWLIYGALINGATMCLYDGSPDYPNADRMWEFSAKHKVEILGISPTLIRVLSGSADTPVRHTKNEQQPSSVHADKSVRAPVHDLSSLRAFASTGEPWNPAPWYWLFEKVGDSKLPIINYSGGTEISGGILMGNPLLPQKAGSFSAPCLGIDADILGEDGESLPAGEVGELAIRKPWIGMARGFWEENERYLETYWSRFEKIWVHGDFAMKDSDEHWYILGRSDDTLNVAGKRVGPAEIESLLVADERVAEAAVIGVPHSIKGTAMVAFCVLTGSADGSSVSEGKKNSSLETHADEPSALQLEAELKKVVAKDMGKPLAPSRIHFVSALPKTRNAKVMRRVIRSAYLGEDAGDLSALENPQTVEEIKKLLN